MSNTRNRGTVGVWIFGVLALWAVVLFSAGIGGCATGGAGSDPVRQIVAYSALIALDVDDLQRDGATQEEKDRLVADANGVLKLVGVDSQIGQTISALLANYAAGEDLASGSWRAVVRVLAQWAASGDQFVPAPARVNK